MPDTINAKYINHSFGSKPEVSSVKQLTKYRFTMSLYVAILATLIGICIGQQAGTLTDEYKPPLPLQVCGQSGCATENTGVVIDAAWRYLYSKDDSAVSCQIAGGYDPVLCPDGLTCAENCALNGIDQNGYNNNIGVFSDNDELRLMYLTGNNVGSAVYLTTEDDKYRLFRLKNKEFTFDVDTSEMPCGLNGALFFSEMEEDGGMSSYPSNTAGAKYGTGVCDGQCKHDLKYMAGEINLSGYSDSGACCAELDLWEANR